MNNGNVACFAFLYGVANISKETDYTSSLPLETCLIHAGHYNHNLPPEINHEIAKYVFASFQTAKNSFEKFSKIRPDIFKYHLKQLWIQFKSKYSDLYKKTFGDFINDTERLIKTPSCNMMTVHRLLYIPQVVLYFFSKVRFEKQQLDYFLLERLLSVHRSNKIIIMKILSSYSGVYLPLLSLSEAEKDDKELMMIAVNSNGLNLSYCSDGLKDDEDIVMTAIKDKPKAIAHASPRLKENENIITTALAQETRVSILCHFSDRIKDDPHYVKLAISNNAMNLYYASTRLKNDRKIVLAAIRQNADSFIYASNELKDDEKIVRIMSKTRTTGSILNHVGERWNDDKEIVKSMIEMNSYNFVYASARLKNDKEILQLALKKNALLLSYASEEIKDDEEIIRFAIQYNSRAFNLASRRIQNMDDIFFQ